jgi:APA family basic amino acid/polyamine antiporter
VVVGSALASLDEMADLCNIGTLSAFVLVCAGVLVLRRRDPARERPFRTPWVPLVPLLGIVACLALMLGLPGLAWVRFGVWLVVGSGVYLCYGRRHSRLAGGG